MQKALITSDNNKALVGNITDTQTGAVITSEASYLTDDATISAENIEAGKIAYGKDGKIIGTGLHIDTTTNVLKGDGQGGAIAAEIGTDYINASDPRLADTRTPNAHKSSHLPGGTDEITPAAINAVPKTRLIANKDLSSDITVDYLKNILGIKNIIVSPNQPDDSQASKYDFWFVTED